MWWYLANLPICSGLPKPTKTARQFQIREIMGGPFAEKAKNFPENGRIFIRYSLQMHNLYFLRAKKHNGVLFSSIHEGDCV